MAEHSDAAEQLAGSAPVDEDGEGHEREADDNAVTSAETPAWRWLTGTRSTIAVGLVIVAALGGAGVKEQPLLQGSQRQNIGDLISLVKLVDL